MKEKKVIYIIFGIMYFIGCTGLLIWNAKIRGKNEAYLPLMMVVVTTIICAILVVLDVRKR